MGLEIQGVRFILITKNNSYLASNENTVHNLFITLLLMKYKEAGTF